MALPQKSNFERAGCRIPRALVRVLMVIAALASVRAAAANTIKATVIAGVQGGYARLIFTMSAYDQTSVRQEGNVLIISFNKPIDISVDRLAGQAPDYIGAARSDPDGSAVRLALARKVTVNAMNAGEQYFVDLLPDTWRGLPPGLPQAVVDALARRAREAERLADRERRIASLGKIPAVRVHVANGPTFTRYIFGVPSQVSVAAERQKNGLTLKFDAPLNFDLEDVQSTLPSTIGAVKAQLQDASATVHFDFLADAGVRTFRDENGYAVDVAGAGKDRPANPAAAILRAAALPGRPAPTVSVPIARARQAGSGALAASAAPIALPPPAISTPPVPPAPAGAVAAATAPSSIPPANARPALIASNPAKGPGPPTRPAVNEASIPIASGPAKGPGPLAPLAVNKPPAPIGSAQAKVAGPPAGTAVQRPAVRLATARPEAAMPPPVAAKRVVQAPRAADGNGQAAGKIPVDLARQNEHLKLSFEFATPTAAAVFNRADTLWIVFDSKADIDLSALKNEATGTIRSAKLTRAPDADIVRIKLARPVLSSVGTDGPVWTVDIGDSVVEPVHGLDLTRSLIGRNRSSMTIPLDAPHELHRIKDPEAGDQLLVVTAFAPARGVIHTQNFIEFRALASEQGVAVEPLADDIEMGVGPDGVVIRRPGGLTLSSSLQTLLRGQALRPATFNPELWGRDRKGSYERRQFALIAAAAAAPKGKRLGPRLDLARFYLARSMYPEAKGVLDVALADARPSSENVSAIVLRAIAEIMMDRPAAALKDLANPDVGDQHDAPLWRALAYARQGKWAEARQGFKSVETAIATLPIELQRFALKEEMRASIEVGDFAEAENELNDLQTIGIPPDMRPALSVLIGQLDEATNRTEDALAAYRAAAGSSDQPAAAQGRLRETFLRYSLGDLKRRDVVSDLESLTTLWRGDETEIEALQMLARLYTEEGRYRDSFYVMRTAMTAHPGWDMTRKIEDEAAKTFDSLFLAGKADSLSPIDALALFYDFRELTPIGSRGDEMIRRLADRLVSVDLLDQAAGLLQYQVDNRLQGAARAEVATRLAVIYLMDRKADKALAVLRKSSSAELSNELRDRRLLLEARALSDLGRHAVALEVIADIGGPVAIRLRSDIYWASHEWDKAAEQIELLYGDRWKQWQPLTDVERSDILRAEIGYALSGDKLGLQRFRDKYAAKMAGTPDAKAFEIVSATLGSGGDDFKDIANKAAAADTLDDFLRDLNARYPEGSQNPSVLPPGLETASAPLKSGNHVKVGGPTPAAPPQTRPAVPNAAFGRRPPLGPSAAGAGIGQTAMR